MTDAVITTQGAATQAPAATPGVSGAAAGQAGAAKAKFAPCLDAALLAVAPAAGSAVAIAADPAATTVLSTTS